MGHRSDLLDYLELGLAVQVDGIPVDNSNQEQMDLMLEEDDSYMKDFIDDEKRGDLCRLLSKSNQSLNNASSIPVVSQLSQGIISLGLNRIEFPYRWPVLLFPDKLYPEVSAFLLHCSENRTLR